MSHTTPNRYFLAGGAFSALASLMHLGCVAFGAPWLRMMGAGERFAQLDLEGHWTPRLVALAIALVLAVWSAYAFAGAGVIRKLPFTRLALCAIAAIYSFRGLTFPILTFIFPGNSAAFWLATSATSFLVGLAHVKGLRQTWDQLD